MPRPLGYDIDDHRNNGVGMETMFSLSAPTSSHLIAGNLRTNKDKIEKLIVSLANLSPLNTQCPT
jgi:hypothetical protein